MFTKLWTIKESDFVRGLLVAILTTPLTVILTSAQAGSLVFEWKKIIAGAIAGGVAYILKNFITGEQGNILTNK